MKAAVCYGSGRPLVIEQRPDPAPAEGEVIIEVERSGICGSELHLHEGPPRLFPDGMVMGHEYSGRIVELGPGVGGLQRGQRVAVFPALGCGTCEACSAGNCILCPRARRIMGGFAELASVPAHAAIPLPEALTAADGALVEPLTVSLYGVRLGGLRPGCRVLVLGAGAIALTAVYWARRLGAGAIAAISRSAHRAELAIQMGADEFLTYGEHEQEAVIDALGGEPDVVLECVGAPGFLNRAITHARLMGKVVSLGFCTQPDTVMPAVAGMKGVRLEFAVGYTRQDFSYAAGAMLTGHVDPKIMISSTVPLEELPAMFTHLLGRHAETKVHIAPGIC